MNLTPTEELYSSLQAAFDHFNRELFDGCLPDVIFTMQRKQKCMGYLSPERWASSDNERLCHELAINPAFIGNSSLLSMLQTLGHEACHLWQYVDPGASPSRKGYHNKEWASKMESIGLMPSDTGKPGGKKTGQYMSDYPIPGGRFLEVCKTLIKDQSFRIPWFDRWAEPADGYELPQEIVEYLEAEDAQEEEEGSESNIVALLSTPLAKLLSGARDDVFLPTAAKAQPTRTKYQCGCQTNIWGKPGLLVRCEVCNERFSPIE